MFGPPRHHDSVSVYTKTVYTVSEWDTAQCSARTPQANVTGVLATCSSPLGADFSSITLFSIMRIITDFPSSHMLVPLSHYLQTPAQYPIDHIHPIIRLGAQQNRHLSWNPSPGVLVVPCCSYLSSPILIYVYLLPVIIIRLYFFAYIYFFADIIWEMKLLLPRFMFNQFVVFEKISALPIKLIFLLHLVIQHKI